MNETTTTEVPNNAPAGLAVSSLVLGILSVLLGIFFIGSLLGLIGLILGLIHLNKGKTKRGMAKWGVGLSVLGMVLAVVTVSLVYFLLIPMVEKSGCFNDFSATEWVGVPAPELTVTTLDGEQIMLSELKGRRVVLDMWATWCSPCIRSIPQYIQLQNETSRDELILVGISDSKKKRVEAIAKEQGINYPLVVADELPAPYSDITSFPTVFFIDRNGVIQDIKVGIDTYEILKESALADDYAGALKESPLMKQLVLEME